MRVVLSYIMKFIQSISFFLLSLSLILIFTVFNEDYVLDLLNNHNYYQELYDNTLEEVSYYLEQSGLNEEVLNNVISVKSLKKEIITTIDNLYTNQKITVNTEEFQNNLTTNINNYIKDNNIRVDNKDTVNILTKKLVNIYEEEISYNNTFEKVRPMFNKAYKLTKIVLYLSIIVSIVTYLINRYIFKDRNIIASLFTNFVILVGLVLYIKYTIDINNIFSISNILMEFIHSVLKYMLVTGILSFLLGLFIVFMATGTFKALRKNKKLFHSILVIIWMLVIFNFSSQNGSKSTKTSDVVTSMVVNVTTSVTNKDIPREEVKKKVEDSTFLVRKTAHFTEYLILGILVLQLLSDYTKINKRMLIVSLIICYLYAVSDEVHQIFISGRTAKVLDTFIDGAGSLVGITIYSIYQSKCRKMSYFDEQ